MNFCWYSDITGRQHHFRSTIYHPQSYPVKVVEGGSELIHLLLGDALCIPCQDLGLHLVDGSSDGCQQQLPPNTDVLQGNKGNDQPQVLPACWPCFFIFLIGEFTPKERSWAYYYRCPSTVCLFSKIQWWEVLWSNTRALTVSNGTLQIKHSLWLKIASQFTK